MSHRITAVSIFAASQHFASAPEAAVNYSATSTLIKNKSNENFKTTNPSHNKDRPKTTGECEMF
jgi:ubiquinone biosynthesis protein COQ9